MSARQIAESEIADAHPHEPVHFVAELVKHAADLSVDALSEENAHDVGFERKNAFQLRAFAVEHDAAQKFRGQFRFPRAIERDLVFLIHFVTRMGKTLREVTVVREDEQAFALGIEPADIEEPRAVRGQQIEDRVARVWIAPGGDEAGGFVQDEVQLALEAHHFAADFDVIGLGWLRAEIGHDPTVDGDAPGGDEFVAMATGSDAGRSQKAVQAHEKGA